MKCSGNVISCEQHWPCAEAWQIWQLTLCALLIKLLFKGHLLQLG